MLEYNYYVCFFYPHFNCFCYQSDLLRLLLKFGRKKLLQQKKLCMRLRLLLLKIPIGRSNEYETHLNN